MSDTPRTECYVLNPLPQVVSADFARELERELNAANSRIELLMSANADVARIAGERDEAEKRIRLLIAERDTARLQADKKHSLRGEFQSLLGTDNIEEGIKAVKALMDRIKRLQEDSERLHWLLNRGLAWRDCYDDHWINGEWLYASQDAIETIDKAMEAKP